MSLHEFGTKFVQPYNNPKRNTAFAALEELLVEVHKLRIYGELWLDGSFLTEKTEPKDIDGLFVVHHEAYDGLSDQAKKFLDDLMYSAENLPDVLDLFATIHYPSNHEFAGLDPIDGWSKLYGTQNDERWAKGFVVISLET